MRVDVGAFVTTSFLGGFFELLGADIGELEGQPPAVFPHGAEGGPDMDPGGYETRVGMCLVGIDKLKGHGLYRIKSLLRVGLDAADVGLNVGGVFGTDITPRLDGFDMKGS